MSEKAKISLQKIMGKLEEEKNLYGEHTGNVRFMSGCIKDLVDALEDEMYCHQLYRYVEREDDLWGGERPIKTRMTMVIRDHLEVWLNEMNKTIPWDCEWCGQEVCGPQCLCVQENDPRSKT